MSAPSLSLHVTLSSGESLELSPSGSRQVLGRGRDCQLILADPAVSRKHAEIYLEEGDWFIEDLGSANGTLLNGRKIERARLADGDSLQLGGCRITVAIAAPAPVGEATVVAAAPKAGAAPRRRAKKAGGGKNKLVLVGGIAVAVMLVLIIAISIMGGKKKKKSAPAPAPAVSSSQPATPTKPATPAPAKSATPAPAVTPAPNGGKKLPAATQAKVDKLMEQAQIYYEAGRWQEALAQWRQVLILDPAHALARSRLERVQNQINRKAQEALARGLQNYKYLKYQAAIQDWMQVLYLVPDPNNPVHKKAKEYIQQARSKLSR